MALALWDGAGAVRLYRFDRDHTALLLERCRPGVSLAAGELGPEESLAAAAAVAFSFGAASTPQRQRLPRPACRSPRRLPAHRPWGSRVTELAAKAQMAKPSMAYLVEYLEAAGYLVRRPDPTDGRARLVQLTRRGWREIEDALDIIADLEAELGASLGPRRLQTLRQLLTEVTSITTPWRRPTRSDAGEPM